MPARTLVTVAVIDVTIAIIAPTIAVVAALVSTNAFITQDVTIGAHAIAAASIHSHIVAVTHSIAAVQSLVTVAHSHAV